VSFLNEMKDIIYADNAATTKLDEEAFEAMKPYMLDVFGNPSQAYSLARPAKEAIKKAREMIAACINAEPDEIYFTSGGTESDNWALKGVAYTPSDRKAIIVSCIEHHAILNSCKALEKQGYPVAYLQVDSSGTVQSETLKGVITDNTKLVSVMAANNEIGTVQPIKELASIIHRIGAIFHTDAVQAVGHIKIDVKDLCVDLLSASAHKFNGPKGVGFLYIKNGTPITTYLDGGSQQSGMRAGTENVAAIVGMAVALKNCCSKMTEQEQLLSEEKYIVSELSKRLGEEAFMWNGNHEEGKHLPGLISLSFKDKDGEAIMHRMDLKGIMISTGAACNSVNTEVSHVIKAIGVPDSYENGTIRISLGHNNTHEDVTAVCNHLYDIVC